MKVLFTGCTSKQTDDNAWQRARVKRIDDSTIICNSLRKQGYVVDRRKVQWGDDLSEYGLAIVGLGQFGSNNYSGELFNALYAISKVKNVIVFHEDWKIDGTIKSFTSMLDDEVMEKSVTKKWSDGRHFYGGVDNPNFDRKVAKQIIQNVVDGKYNALIPAFDWGDKQKVRDIIGSEKIYNVDLTPYVLENWNIPLNIEPVQKQKKHMLASLVDHRSWVRKNKLTWDVDYFGAKSLKAPQLPTETDVFEKCGEYWSVLCPEYPHAGSGWFRIRWIYAAIQKSILLSSPKDLEALGLPVANIEKMSETDLEQYASQQSATVLGYMQSKEDFDNRIKDIVEENCNNLTIDKSNSNAPLVTQSLF